MGNILEPSVVSATSNNSGEQDVLLRTNYLSEFETEDEKSVARENLGVYAKTFVYTQDEAQLMMQEKIHAALQGYVSSDELPKAIMELSQEIADAGYVKSDGSVPFTNPQSQSSLPTSANHLTNKSYVDNLLRAHVNGNDPHKTMDQVKVLLADYAKVSDVYTITSSYSKSDIDSLLGGYIKRDGSVPFTKPQIGIDPALPSHLATARYVQLVMQNHKCEADPHEFLSTLQRYLSNYYTKSETYTKAQTYSRSQLLDIIKSQMKDVVDQALAEYSAEEGSVSELKDYVLNQLYTCIKADGSVAHIAPQQGVAAVKDNEFVVLSQLTEAINQLATDISTSIKESTNQSTWITSGPVKATVGFISEDTVMPIEMTVQEVCDSIFYGRTIGIEAPLYAEYGEQVCIKIYTYGLTTINEIDLYKNNNLIGTIRPSDFDPSADTVDGGFYYEYCDTGEFTEDTEWKAVFYYSDDRTLTDYATTKLSYPIFIGAVPYWWNAQEDITINSLRELIAEDPGNCRMVSEFGPDINLVETSFNFKDAKGRSIVIVLPNNYPNLAKLITPTQSVTVEAFAKWVQPMHPNNNEVGVLYKIYVFNQALVQLDQTVKFQFEKIIDTKEEKYE